MLDLKGAYQQLVVSEYTKSLLAIQTIKGLYRFKRLPFGVKPAASIFQSVMDQILTGLENVQVYIDDILIWAKDDRIGEQLLYSSSRSRLTLSGPNDLYLLISFVTHTNT